VSLQNLIILKTNILLLCQALAESQLQNERLIKAYHELYVKYRGLLVSQPKGAKRRIVDNIKATEDKEVKLLGKKYAIMVEPWIDPELFAPRPEGVNISDPDNYKSELFIGPMRAEELYDFVPEKFHDAIESRETFRTMVSQAPCL
jgi:hypothetical protein